MTLRIGTAFSLSNDGFQRLFIALERAFPVRFLPLDLDDPAAFDGVISDAGFPCYEFLDRCRSPKISFLPAHAERPEPQEPESSTIEFSDDEYLDIMWRGASLKCSEVGLGTGLKLIEGERLLALREGKPHWVTCDHPSGTLERVAAVFPVLGDKEILRDRFKPGCFARLLPLVHFLGRLVRSHGWRVPPLRATFLIDDPNLHAFTYGRLDYRKLVQLGNSFDYSTAIATVPIDGWYINSRVAELFRNHPKRLSMLIHGNNHLREEMAQRQHLEEKVSIMAEAWRRMDAVERETGIFVSRVMAPPHGSCDETALRALLLCGYHAACISRPYPWLPSPPRDELLATWFPADLVAGGCPVIPRYSMTKPVDEIRFRAWLGQAIVLYGHHYDLADNASLLAERAQLINSFGRVNWCSLDEIAHSNYISWRDGDKFYIDLFCLNARVKVPYGCAFLSVSVPHVHDRLDRILVTVQGRDLGRTIELDTNGRPECLIDIIPETILDIRVEVPGSKDPMMMPSPPRRLWPYIRRLLTESRDRLSPFLPLRIKSQVYRP